MIEFWRLKPQLSDAFSVPMLKGRHEKRINTNHVPLAASESEFNNENRIPCLNVGDNEGGPASLYSVNVIKTSRLAIDRLFIL